MLKTYSMLKNILFFLLLFFIGCENPTENEKGNELFGKWQLKIVSGGYAGIHDTLDISKNSNVIAFLSNNVFYYSHNDSVQYSGTFSVSKGKTIFSQDSLETIKYTSDIHLDDDVILYQNFDTLFLSNNYVDSFFKLYTRKH